MKPDCCNGDCNQGRACPLRIPTKRGPAQVIGDLLEDHKWLPLAIAVVLLIIVNYPT